jgi:TRAP-type C4-dicarboxylate transport system permease small subunit
MSPEERELLKRSVELAEENNDILRSIRRSMRLARIMSIVYWVVIIGSAVGALYLIQPYLNTLTGAYGNVTGGAGGLMDLLK